MALFLAGLRGIDDSIIKGPRRSMCLAAAPHLLAHRAAGPAPGVLLRADGAVAPGHQEL